MAFIHKHVATIASVEALAIIVLLAVIAEPFIVARPQAPGSMQGMSAAMMQKFTDIPTASLLPTVDFTITKDAVGGYDVHVITTNFTFTPELINTAAMPDQGHAHLYIDGMLTILLGPWYHIPVLAPGIHTIAVSLNANDHTVFAKAGQAIQVTKQFTASAVQ